MSSAYEKLVASASAGERDLRDGVSNVDTTNRALQWAVVIEEEISHDHPSLLELKQKDIELIYSLVYLKWGEELMLFKPKQKYEHQKRFIPFCIDWTLSIVNSTWEHLEIRRKHEKEIEANPPQPPGQEQKLVLDVANTQLMIDSTEAALAVYTDCSLRGQEITIIYPGEERWLTAQVMQRTVGDTSLCVAIFNRLLMRSAFDSTPFTNERCKCLVFTGRHEQKKVTLYCGNLTEVEFLGEHEDEE